MLSLCSGNGLLGAAWVAEGDDTVYVLTEDTLVEHASDILSRSDGQVMGSMRLPSHLVELISNSREFVMHSHKDYAVSINVPMAARTEHNELSQRALNAIIKAGSVQMVHSEVVLVNMGRHMHVSMQTLQDLDVIDYMDHPNPHFGKTMSGKCLVSMMNKAKSTGGKALLNKWLYFPLFDCDAIEKRQQEISMIRESPGLIESIQSAIRGVKNVQHIIAKLSTDNNCEHLRSIVRFMESVLEVQRTINNSPLSHKISRIDGEEWKNIVATINRIVDFDRSKLEGERVIIKYGVDGHLDELRNIYTMLPDRLSSVAVEIAEHVKGKPNCTVKALNVVYFPQLGYLTAVPILHQYELSGLFTDWELVFTTDKIAYFKNPWMRQLDEQLGDIHAEIVDCEIEIYEEIRQGLLKMRNQLELHYKELCELDCLTAVAQSSVMLDLEQSKTVDSLLSLKESRHVIAEHCCSMIPNDITMDRARPIVVITGPNASGKSILMKQIGLACLMNQAFGYIAANGESTLPKIKSIHTRIRAVESAAQQKSAFAIELEQLKSALRECKEDSLILIDEFGKGTLPEDGIALLTATIEYISELDHPPFCIIVTHFTEIAGLLKDSAKNKIKWLQMNIYQSDHEDPIFMFKAVEGVCSRSLGVYCARKSGMQEAILVEAADIASKLQAGIPARDLAWAAVPEEQEQAMAALIRDTFSISHK